MTASRFNTSLRVRAPRLASIAVLSVAGALLVSGCGGGKSAPVSGAVASASPSATPSAGWEWAAEESAPGTPADAAAAAGTPTGHSLGTGGSTATPSPATGKAEAKAADPCSLVTSSEWSAWSKATAPSPTTLESGGACGWKNDDDSVRMAVGAFRAAGAERWLESQAAPAGQPVSGLGDRATWLPNWPVAQASTLVVEIQDWDLVVEMDSLGGTSDADLRSGAVLFATAALPRLS